MKYFRIFRNTEEYIEYMETVGAVVPNISYCSEDNKTYITPSDVPPPTPVEVTGVTISSTSTTINVGSTATLVATVLPNNATDKAVTWSSDDSTVATVDSNGVVTAVASGDCTITVTTHDGGYTASCNVTAVVPSITTLVIEGAANISAETCNYNAIADNSENVTSSATWSITSGSQYATINSSNGDVTILNGANESSVTIQAVYAGLTATTEVTLTYISGASAETETESTVDIGGNTTTVTTTVTEYEDGSSVEVAETVITDVNGNVIGTTESNKTTNVDGSYNGNTTNYDAEGNPTDGSNVTGDTDGNVSTQSVTYDESGNTVVTGYDIDTSGSESGKTFNGDGVNTEYYAFDVTHGFELDFAFTIDFNNQPTGQSQDHHNILTSKRADPEPWYGFQLRQTKSDKVVKLGTQFETGDTINAEIAPVLTGNTGGYSLKIVYNPTNATRTFVCTNMLNSTDVFVSDDKFPDIEDLKYLKVTIGYALTSSGTPFRYSNINVSNFSLKKLKNVANPTISCSENVVTISCATTGATTYYRLNLSGEYSAYTSSFTITADTVVQAYSVANGDTSDTVQETCIFTVPNPVIACDGEYVTITCTMTGVSIYYRLNESGSYSAYTSPFEITADTVVESYAELGEDRSEITKETCRHAGSIIEPVITCVNDEVSITCETAGATIYYRLNESGSYSAYTASFEITATTIVEAYGELDSKTSTTANTTCTLTDFTTKYFTIESLEDDNVIHLRRGSVTSNTEYYSVDSGASWHAFTSGSGDKEIVTINSGDTMWIKCTATKWANAWNSYNNFYSTKNIKVYGNIMSLLYGENFATATTISANAALVGLFFGTSSSEGTNATIVSAKNLVLPATTVTATCYNGMFRNCINLVDGPKVLPATAIYQDSYASMFEGCVKLVEPPVISATTASGNTAMARMFCMNRNSKVTAAMTKSPILRIANTANSSNLYQELFKGNGSLTEVTLLAEGTNLSFSNWLINTNSGGVIKKLSATTLTSGNSGVPTGWTTEDITA